MKKIISISVLFVAIYTLTSCASNQGHGCGYWSVTETPQEEERHYQFPLQTEPTCTNVLVAD